MAITDKLAAIADAIRANTGETDKMTLDQMPAKIFTPPYIAVEAQLQDYRIGEQSSWTYPPQEGMAFAGWFKDAALTVPCGISDTSGTAWAKFVKVTDLLQFRGASMSKSKDTPAGNTGLRFSYNVAAPKMSKFVGMGIYGRFANKVNDHTFSLNAASLRTDGYADSNLVLNSMPVKYYKTPYIVKYFMKYTTVDGTTLEIVEDEYHEATMVGIADSVLANPMATDADKTYAMAIKEAAL